jgi:hypothetical protein
MPCPAFPGTLARNADLRPPYPLLAARFSLLAVARFRFPLLPAESVVGQFAQLAAGSVAWACGPLGRPPACLPPG